MAGTPIKRARHEKALAILAKPEFWEQLWEHLAEGNTLRSFVSGSDIPYGVLWRKMQSDPVLMERYEIVRNARALANAERIEALADKVETEQIDPNAAKVAMSARQWLAERMDPKRWGNRIQQDVKITDMNQLHLQAVRDLMRTVSVQNPEKLTLDTATDAAPDARDSTDRAE
jgi:hypothetical protein